MRQRRNNKLHPWLLPALLSLPNDKNEEVRELERRGKERKCSLRKGCQAGFIPHCYPNKPFACIPTCFSFYGPESGARGSQGTECWALHTESGRIRSLMWNLSTLWPFIQNFQTLVPGLPEETRNHILQFSADNRTEEAGRVGGKIGEGDFVFFVEINGSLDHRLNY